MKTSELSLGEVSEELGIKPGAVQYLVTLAKGKGRVAKGIFDLDIVRALLDQHRHKRHMKKLATIKRIREYKRLKAYEYRALKRSKPDKD